MIPLAETLFLKLLNGARQNATELKIVCGPFESGHDEQAKTLQFWAEKVKALSGSSTLIDLFLFNTLFMFLFLLQRVPKEVSMHFKSVLLC